MRCHLNSHPSRHQCSRKVNVGIVIRQKAVIIALEERSLGQAAELKPGIQVKIVETGNGALLLSGLTGHRYGPLSGSIPFPEQNDGFSNKSSGLMHLQIACCSGWNRECPRAPAVQHQAGFHSNHALAGRAVRHSA